MLQPVFSAFEKLILEFSWRRVVYVFTIVVVAGGLLGFGEWYTTFFRLNRLSKTAAILETLSNVSHEPSDTIVAALKDRLVAELETTMYPRRIGLPLPTPQLGLGWSWAKFVAGASPWLLLAFVGFRGKQNDAGTVAAIVFVLGIGALFGWIGTLIPTIYSRWINLLLYPLLQLILILTIGIYVALRASRNRSAGRETGTR